MAAGYPAGPDTRELEVAMTPAMLGDRSLFEDLAPRVYLNHAAVSPLSRPVRAAVKEVVDDFATDGVAAVGKGMKARAELRQEVADWLGVGADDIGFPPGTTRGIVDLALAVPWAPGDRVVTFTGEFPSNVTPWHRAARRFGGEACTVDLEGFREGRGDGLAAVEEVLSAGRVRVVAVSAVQFRDGLRMPLSELGRLAHAHGAWLFVDAIQGLGAVPLDLGEVDMLVAGAHKWLMGMDGVAIALARPEVRGELTPLTAGWLSHPDALDFLFAPGLLRYDKPVVRSLDWMEGGVQTTAALAALRASVRLLRGLGVGEVYRHIQSLHDAYEPALQSLGCRSLRATDPAARSATLSVEVPPDKDVAEVARQLGERGVAVSTPDGALRLAPHWPNDAGQVEFVVEALRASLAGAGG